MMRANARTLPRGATAQSDLAGHLAEPAIGDAVEELKGYCQFVKVLGSYPRAK